MSRSAKVLVAGAAVFVIASVIALFYTISWWARLQNGIQLVNEGCAAEFRGDHEEAVRKLTAALENPLPLSSRSYAYLNRAIARNWESNFGEAIRDFNAALRDNPQLVDAYTGRGLAYQRQGETDKALSDLNRAIRTDPNSRWGYYYRGSIYYSKHEYDRAIADLDEAVRCNPSSPDPLVMRGMCYVEKGDLERALANFDGAIAVDPQNANSYRQRSNLYGRKGDWERSRRDADQARRLMPLSKLDTSKPSQTDVRLLIDEANRAHRARDFDRAIARFNHILTLNITPAQASYVVMRRGNAHLWKNQLDAAYSDSQEALKLDPKNTEAHVYLARVLRAMGKRADAVKECDQAIRINPKEFSAYDLRADIFREEGDIHAALADLNELLRLNPKWTIAYVTRSAIYLGESDLDNAIANCNRLIELEPNSTAAYINRARAYARRGRYLEAKSDFECALKNIKPEQLEWQLNTIAWFYATSPIEKLRDGAKAVSEATQACEASGWQNESTLDTLAAAYAEVGNFDQAIAFEEKAMQMNPGTAERQRMEKRLALYKEHKPYRE